MSETKPVALIILDGWGIASDGEGNAVTRARTPFIDSLFAKYPSSSLDCFGEAVGLPAGQMGNSEVGHLNLGAGRVVHQDISRINLAVKDGSIRKNPALSRAMELVLKNNSTLHLMGLMSDGGVHSLMTHLFALIDMAGEKGLSRVAVHSFLDGRDTPARQRGRLPGRAGKIPGRASLRLFRLGGRPFLGHGPGPALGPGAKGL